jgi:hypothetical protein
MIAFIIFIIENKLICIAFSFEDNCNIYILFKQFSNVSDIYNDIIDQKLKDMYFYNAFVRVSVNNKEMII